MEAPGVHPRCSVEIQLRPVKRSAKLLHSRIVRGNSGTEAADPYDVVVLKAGHGWIRDVAAQHILADPLLEGNTPVPGNPGKPGGHLQNGPVIDSAGHRPSGSAIIAV